MDLNCPRTTGVYNEVREFTRANLDPAIARKGARRFAPRTRGLLDGTPCTRRAGSVSAGPNSSAAPAGTRPAASSTKDRRRRCAAAHPLRPAYGCACDHGVRQQPSYRDYHLPRILSGENWWCQGYSEPGSGSISPHSNARPSVRRLLHRQRPEDLDRWASMPTGSFCLVRTSSEGRQQEGISFLLIDIEDARHHGAPIIMLDQEHG